MRYLIWVIFLSMFVLQSCDRKTDNSFEVDKENFIHGKVIGIFDGDTYSLLTDDNKTLKVRMEGIDAPEKDMPYHTVSRKKLSSIIFKKKIYLDKTGEDIHDRTLGFTYLEDGTDVNLIMLKAGMVWHFKRYNDDDNYAKAEDDARNQRIGLWKEDHPQSPWSFRRNNRNNF